MIEHRATCPGLGTCNNHPKQSVWRTTWLPHVWYADSPGPKPRWKAFATWAEAWDYANHQALKESK